MLIPGPAKQLILDELNANSEFQASISTSKQCPREMQPSTSIGKAHHHNKRTRCCPRQAQTGYNYSSQVLRLPVVRIIHCNRYWAKNRERRIFFSGATNSSDTCDRENSGSPVNPNQHSNLQLNYFIYCKTAAASPVICKIKQGSNPNSTTLGFPNKK